MTLSVPYIGIVINKDFILQVIIYYDITKYTKFKSNPFNHKDYQALLNTFLPQQQGNDYTGH